MLKGQQCLHQESALQSLDSREVILVKLVNLIHLKQDIIKCKEKGIFYTVLFSFERRFKEGTFHENVSHES
jgi:hypothetical protein